MARGKMIVTGNPNASHWSLESGNEIENNGYPIRVIDSGPGTAIDITLQIMVSEYENMCHGIDQGELYLFNLQNDFPYQCMIEYQKDIA